MALTKATYDFLRDLKENNNREWFQENKGRYEQAHQEVKEFLQEMIFRLSEIDPHIHRDISVSRCLFRIYRDVRFSKNKAPYKNWFAAGISVDGRKLDGPEYYLHIEPERTFVAVGYWRPNKEHLAAIRQEIDYNAEGLVQALEQGDWKLADLDEEDKLVRPPVGYPAEHSYIEVLKLKSFILYQEISEEVMTGSRGIDEIITVCKRILPFKNFIHTAIDQ